MLKPVLIVAGSAASARDRAEGWLLATPRTLHAVAACRIGTALSVFGLLLSNFSSREVWVGPAAVWAEPARAISTFPELALLDGVSGDVLFVIYVATMLSSLALLLGWRAKGANVLTFVGFIAIVGQNPVVGGQSDNLVRLTLLWLLLMRTSDVWSLDAVRRRRRIEAGAGAGHGEDVLPPWLSAGLHHVGLIGLAIQTCLLYLAAGLDKVADVTWRNGTALYYTMQLPDYRPFPWLSDLLSDSRFLLGLVTYSVLLAQLFFAPLLLNPITRRIVTTLAIVVNVVFAVVFAQVWASAAMIAVTMLFASDSGLERFGLWLGDRFAPAADWVALRWYSVADALDELRHRTITPVVDWFVVTVLRR